MIGVPHFQTNDVASRAPRVIVLLFGSTPISSANMVTCRATAPAGVAPFNVTGEFDRTYFDVDACVDILNVNGAVLRLGYLGRFSDHVSAGAATLKVSVPF